MNSTIDLKKIQNSYENSVKNSENISKFSRRTINCFLDAPAYKRVTKTEKKHPRTKKLKSIKAIHTTTTISTPKNDDHQKFNEKNEENNEKHENHENNEKQENPEKFIDGGTIEESKTLEESLKKQQDNDVKQSGIIVSEIIENGQSINKINDKNIDNEEKNNVPDHIVNINIEKSVNLEKK